MIDMQMKSYRSRAKARKRCPQCGQMIEVGAPVIVLTFLKPWWGWQRGGFIGEGARRMTHLYHEQCAREAPQFIGLLEDSPR